MIVPFRLMVRAVAITVLMVLSSVRLVAAGGLSFVQFLDRGIDIPTSFFIAEGIASSPDGFNVYVVTRGDDTLVSFDRDLVSGELSFLDFAEDGVGGVDGLRDACAVAVGPSSTNVYVAGEGDDAVAVFTSFGGFLSFVEVHEDGVAGVTGLDNPNAVVASDDGAHVYVSGESSDSLVLFDVVGFGLSFVETYENGVAGVVGLNAPQVVTLSPDGEHVYVGTSSTPDGIALFRRDTDVLSLTYGQLTFVEAVTVEDFGNVRDIAVTADGTGVYAIGSFDSGSAVVVFARNTAPLSPDFGKLTFVEAEMSKTNGLKNSLGLARAITLGADDRHVYVAADSSNAMVIFRRDPASGLLTFIEQLSDGTFEDALAEGAVMSPDQEHLYVVDGSEMVVFAVDRCGNGSLGADEQCDDGNMTGGDGCSASCTLEVCGGVPLGGCRGSTEPLKSVVRLKQGTGDDGKDKLQWKWGKGEATALAEFGDPTATASYVLCLYDGSVAAQPLLSVAAPAAGLCKNAKPCWALKGSKSPKYKYNDAILTPDGVQNVLLTEALAPGKGKLIVKGKGVTLGLPDLPLTLPVTVQLVNTETAVCWESVHTVVQKNEPSQFKARGD